MNTWKSNNQNGLPPLFSTFESDATQVLFEDLCSTKFISKIDTVMSNFS